MKTSRLFTKLCYAVAMALVLVALAGCAGCDINDQNPYRDPPVADKA